MKQQLPYRLKQLQTSYILIKLVEVATLCLAIGLLTWALLGWINVSDATRWITTILVAGLSGTTMAYFQRLFALDPNLMIRILNNNYPELEESVDLLISDEAELNLVQRIQRSRIEKKFEQVYPQIKVPNNVKTTSKAAAALVFASIMLMAFAPDVNQTELGPLTQEVERLNTQVEEAKLESILVTIAPPAYMAQPAYTSNDLHLVVPEGSMVSWKIIFNKPATTALIFSGRDSVALASDKVKTYTRKITDAGFYQLVWQDKGEWILSDYYKIEIVKDQPPKLNITNLEQFTRFEFVQPLKVEVKASLQDDFGLVDASVIATVSKGSGESVKFREEKLKFDSPPRISGKQVQAAVTLDLIKLGLEPGDELYFYVEANDIKVPISNYSRTETFFIAIQDTTQYSAVEDEGLGVDLMPEYFRSQRQIIIDTEKLLKEKKKITTQQFKFTSNELGYDQKVLRLRYGQFMGEEFEDQIGGGAIALEDDHETAEETVKRFGHQHDTENEHNLVEQKKAGGNHNHNHSPKQEEDEDEDPLAAFAHQHDDGEQATFFVESVRAKLKAALTVMWDAELYLRLYEPEKSLPYQYTALKLLKEISNDSRIYVHRTGFDPPPLKEEKRLSGDLAEVRSYTGTSKQPDQQDYPAIRQAQQVLEKLIVENINLTDKDKVVLTQAGNELAAAALEQPGKYLDGLSVLKKLVEGNVPETEWRSSIATLRKIFMQVAPRAQESPSEKTQAVHVLDQQFLKNLND
jgi:bifunctional DNA-binding transcriptional regulator/antitoxin component of YhaV-PrlF toxin-antitoxin module